MNNKFFAQRLSAAGHLVQIFLFFVLILLLPACTGSKGPVSMAVAAPVAAAATTSAASTRHHNNYPVFTDEARLFDIPLPIGSKVYNLSSRQEYNKRILNFSSSLSQFDLFAYYRTEMECFGWEETATFEGIESCLVFAKPTKLCVVTIRPDGQKSNTVSLFIGPRKIAAE